MNIAIFAAIVAVGLGVFGAYGLTAGDNSSATMTGNSFMTGHLTLIATDENGVVKAYRQTDNIVLNDADNCFADLGFGSTLCTSEALFNDIHIGVGGTPGSTTPVEAELDPLPVDLTGAPATGSVGQVAASGTGGAVITLTATFADVNASVNEAALRDAADTTDPVSDGNAIAYQEFTAIVLGASDDLTISWAITVDGN